MCRDVWVSGWLSEEFLFPGDEHQTASGAPNHRANYRSRHRQGDDRRCQRWVALLDCRVLLVRIPPRAALLLLRKSCPGCSWLVCLALPFYLATKLLRHADVKKYLYILQIAWTPTYNTHIANVYIANVLRRPANTPNAPGDPTTMVYKYT